ncbi:adenylosuccinate synthase [Desulfovermiculus halophilus]|jgi:adenylosuccinate synthase|uniref:adenylosuccinate synthase n=1 Tax=Desulfovermiculus halophilus TaxID=339722 RepID=UPI000553AC15|nr:adenylosuccinate synthase [Desulfovermiculus halophilus]
MAENVVVVGAQWGDEGKGKIVDLLTEKVEVIVRFQGGNNAGHTLVVKGHKVVLHLIPSGILHPDKLCLIGNGVVLDPEVFCRELDGLNSLGVQVGPSSLKISRKTHLIMPYHKLLDSAREEKKKGPDKIGTTGRGIGPAYEDKVARTGIRAADVLKPQLMLAKMEKAVEEKNVLFQHYFDQPPVKVKDMWEAIQPWTERLKPYLADISAEIASVHHAGKPVLFEGAQGTHLDIDHGTYPYVTSSNTLAGNASAGSGCGPSALHKVVAVVKAYTTRVGAGPFPTELDDETGRHLQTQGAEFGATTGRARRCGWLDLVVLRESCRLNAPQEIALTKLDVLSGLPQIRVCTGYESTEGRLAFPPQMENGLSQVDPVYETLPGWEEDISEIRSFAALPAAAQEYIRCIEQELGVKVGIISVGPDREQTLVR